MSPLSRVGTSLAAKVSSRYPRFFGGRRIEKPVATATLQERKVRVLRSLQLKITIGTRATLVFSLAVLIVLSRQVVLAELVIVNFTGVVTQVDDPDAILPGSITVSTVVTGSYTYESTTPDSIPADPTFALYEMSVPPNGITMSIGGFTFASAPGADNFGFNIIDNLFFNDMFMAKIGICSSPPCNQPGPGGSRVDSLGFILEDPAQLALSSDALVIPCLGDFPIRESVFVGGCRMPGINGFCVDAGAIGVYRILGEISSLTPTTSRCGNNLREGCEECDGSDGAACPAVCVSDCTCCRSSGPENTAGACADGIDNDCDGLTDCADPDCCGVAPCCTATETNCTDYCDNDCDGLVDCADPGDCPDANRCCGNQFCDVPAEDCATCPLDCWSATEAGLCDDTRDNDCDGCWDTEDDDCGGPETDCTNGWDDDCDGLVDCADTSDCPGGSPCDDENACTTGDACSTGACEGAPNCGGPSCCGVEPCCIATETVCADGCDNDCDGRVDDADRADCRGGSPCPPARTYSHDADFDEGDFVNVNHDTRNQLQLNPGTEPFPVIWVAASTRGTIVRIDTETGEVLGEYYSAPDGRGRNPSRTTVDLEGSVWSGNRDESGPFGEFKGSVVKIGLIVGGTRVNFDGSENVNGDYLKGPFDHNTCENRDGDGLIKTSRGLGDIRPWPSGGFLGGDVSTAEDECIVRYVRVHGPNVRHVSVDSDGNVWVGGSATWGGGNAADNTFDLLDGDTGAILATFTAACGGYGGMVDADGVLWSAFRGLAAGIPTSVLRYDTKRTVSTVDDTWLCLGTPDSYGLGIDNDGNIWNSQASANTIIKFYPTGARFSGFPKAAANSGRPPGVRGVAVTHGDNDVWVANTGIGIGTSLPRGSTVARLNNNGSVLNEIVVGESPTGVAVDTVGKVWVTNFHSNNVMRIDPATNSVDLTVPLGDGAGPYNYSDMTGRVLLETAQHGTWTVVYDSGIDGTPWGLVTWNTVNCVTEHEPSGTSITVEVRAGDSTTLPPTYLNVRNGELFTVVAGRFIEVKVTLNGAALPYRTPVLCDLTVQPDCSRECTTPSATLVGWWPGDGDAVNVIDGVAGTLHNDVSFEAGIVDQAFKFNGSALCPPADFACPDPTQCSCPQSTTCPCAYVEVPHSDSLSITGTITIDFWARKQAFTPDLIMEKGGDWSHGRTNYGVALNPDKFYFLYAGGCRGVAPVTDLLWHHYAVVARHGDDEPVFYIDAIRQGPVARCDETPITLYPSTEPLHIGAQIDSPIVPPTGTETRWNYWGNAIVDELQIYNGPLSQAEIQAIFSAGSSGKCKPVTADVGMGSTGTLNPGAPDGTDTPTEEALVAYENNCGTNVSISVLEVFGNPHPDAFGSPELETALSINTSPAPGELSAGCFQMTVSIPFDAADLPAGTGPCDLDLLWFNPTIGAWELAVVGNSGMAENPSAGTCDTDTRTQVGCRSCAAAVTSYLGDHGIYWDGSVGFVWANVDHTSYFAAGVSILGAGACCDHDPFGGCT